METPWIRSTCFFFQKNSKMYVWWWLFFKEFLIQLYECVVVQVSKLHQIHMHMSKAPRKPISKYTCRFLFCFMFTGEEEECSFCTKFIRLCYWEMSSLTYTFNVQLASSRIPHRSTRAQGGMVKYLSQFLWASEFRGQCLCSEWSVSCRAD